MTMDKFIDPFSPELPIHPQGVPRINTLNSYFPIRTNESPFSWEAVIGLLLGVVLRKSIGNYSLEQFELDCQTKLVEKLGEEDFWNILQEMYFEQKDILKISPEMLLFKSQKVVSVDERIAKMFANHLMNLQLSDFGLKSNFIEQEFLSILNSKLEKGKITPYTEEPYLPELTQVFRKDFKFLSKYPKYLLKEFESFLSFYAFTYTSQLSLSLPDWRSGSEPKAKPLYFIMDHERASKERVHLKKYGYQLVSESLVRLFPTLSMLEILQPSKGGKETLKVPLWEISRRIQESEHDQLILTERLKQFAHAFKTKRELDFDMKDTSSALGWLENILALAETQFKSGGKKGLDEKYAKSVEKIMLAPFIQSRGRSGRVLVLNQDYIILLTNLVVGEKDKLRFHELIAAFKQRGIFVDKQTEQELIKFYERIGNVERMSDSGDAVYVRKTI